MIARPLRRGVVLFLIVLIVEYLVVPELTGASKDLNLLGQLNPYWLAAGVILEGLSPLKVPRGSGLRAMRQAVTGMTSRNEVSAAPPTPADGQAEPPATPPAQADRTAARADRHGDRTSGPARGDSVLGDAP